jgi:O-antigen ligase
VRLGQNTKIIDKSSNSVWFLIIGVAAVTLFFKTDFYDPFNSAKLILLLLITGWLLGHLINSYRARPLALRTTEFNATILQVGFVISLLVSTFQTDVFLVGLLGDTQRRNGFLAYFGLSVIFLYTIRSIKFSNVIRVYQVGILTGVALSLYGIIQISGKDIVAWDNPYNSMISTLGNPNFASATLAILLLISLFGIFLNSLNIFFKALSFLVIVLSLIAIVISGSRQGLLVIFFSILFYVSVYSIIRSRKSGALVTSVSFIGAILALLGMLQKGPLTSILYKDSVSVRGYYWRAGIEMFKESPLTGVGVDRYGAYFRQFREVGYPLKNGFEVTSSNAHNTFIQLFATSGLFVGVLYLLIVLFIFLSGINLLRICEKQERKIVLGIMAAWVGFQAQSLISIDNIGISVWGWLLGGSIVGLSSRAKTKINQSDLPKNKGFVQINLFQPAVSLLMLVPIIVFSTGLYKDEQNMFLLKAYANPAYPENKPKVQILLNRIYDNPAIDPFYKYRSSFFAYDMGYKDEAYLSVSKSLASDPINPEFLNGMVFLERSRNNTTNEILLRNRIAATDPWNAANYLELLKIYKNSGDLVKAEDMKAKIFSFASGTDIAKTAEEIIR